MALTKEEYFELYSKLINRKTIALRMNQLFSNLPAGAFKDQAKAVLKQELLDAVNSRIDGANASIQRMQDETIANVSAITTDSLDPALVELSEINDTELP